MSKRNKKLVRRHKKRRSGANVMSNSKTKKIIWVHGTKGGIGKSMMSSVVIDYLLSKGKTVAIIEGDGSVPDVRARFGDGVPSLLSPLNSDKSVYEMLAGLEMASVSGNIEYIVVNLPANAELIDSIAEDVHAVTDELGYTNHTLFMISASTDSVNLLQRSANDGIVSISKTAIAVINKHFGENAMAFAWADSTERNSFLTDASHHDMVLPVLQDRVKVHNDFQKGTFSRFTKPDSPFMVVDRVVMSKWLREAHSIVEKLVEE